MHSLQDYLWVPGLRKLKGPGCRQEHQQDLSCCPEIILNESCPHGQLAVVRTIGKKILTGQMPTGEQMQLPKDRALLSSEDWSVRAQARSV